MLIRVRSIRGTLQLLRTRDPERDALRRAIRAAIMVPVAAGFTFVVVGGRVAPLFTLLGAFWLLVVTVSGEIDLVTAPTLEQAIGAVVADSPTALVIDLSAVEFLGSVGLKILAATYEKLGKSTEFGVVARGPATRRPIHLTGLDKSFPLYPTLDDALTAVRDGRLNR